MFKTVKFVELFDSLEHPSLFGDNKTNSERFQLGYELYKKDEDYYIKVLLADVKKENISVKLEKGNLLISALRMAPDQPSLYSNIVYGELYRIIPLGNLVDVTIEDCSAEFKEGVLLIKLVKKLNSKNHIDIK